MAPLEPPPTEQLGHTPSWLFVASSWIIGLKILLLVCRFEALIERLHADPTHASGPTGTVSSGHVGQATWHIVSTQPNCSFYHFFFDIFSVPEPLKPQNNM